MYENFLARQDAELEAAEAQRLLPREQPLQNWPGQAQHDGKHRGKQNKKPAAPQEGRAEKKGETQNGKAQ